LFTQYFKKKYIIKIKLIQRKRGTPYQLNHARHFLVIIYSTKKKGVIFVQPILYDLCDNHFFPIFIGQKQLREKKKKNKKTCEYERDGSKVVKKILVEYCNASIFI